MNIFVAEIETNTTESHGYGETPEQAVSELLHCWRERHSRLSGADADYLDDIREDLKVFEVELGRGYVIGATDTFSRKIVATGDDARFDNLFPTSYSTFKR